MPLFGSSLGYHYPKKELKDYSRDDLEEFVKDRSLDEDAISAFRKANRLATASERIAGVGAIITLVSVLTLVVIPVYSLTAEFTLKFLDLPSFIERFVNQEPSIQTSTLLIVTIIGGGAALVTFSFSKVASKLEEHGDSSGIGEGDIQLHLIAQGYQEFSNGNYREGVKKLKDYDFLFKKNVGKYTESIQVDGQIDEDYAKETYDDFFGVIVERITPASKSSPDILELIANRYESDYYIDEQDAPEKQEHADSYIGIIKNALSGTFSDSASRVSSLILEKPIVPYGIFLAIGVGFIRFSPH